MKVLISAILVISSLVTSAQMSKAEESPLLPKQKKKTTQNQPEAVYYCLKVIPGFPYYGHEVSSSHCGGCATGLTCYEN